MILRSIIISAITVLLAATCEKDQTVTEKPQEDFTAFVNPFIGTGHHGHTFPGATTPNGLVQLSPDTRFLYWDAASGYHYSDSSIAGFSHTHLSGTGVGDYGDFLFMPFTGNPKMKPGSLENPDDGYRSRFSHHKEKASPGYYGVHLNDYDIKAELTASSRAGFHKYSYPGGKPSGLIIDLSTMLHKHRRHYENLINEITIINNKEIRGYRKVVGWARDRNVYFHARFSKPFTAKLYDDGTLTGKTKTLSTKKAQAKLSFDIKEDEEVLIKVGISMVDDEGAKKNLEAEIPHWDFSKVHEEAINAWNKKLRKIEVKGGTEAQKINFYTALYHSYIHPNIFEDVDGRYRGMDHKIHQSGEKEIYTVFSIWDTYRAFHPLMTIIEPDLNKDFIVSLIDKAEQGGVYPKWELASNYTGTMIGYHAASIIADAYIKGTDGFNVEKAYQKLIRTAHYDTSGIYCPSKRVLRNVMPLARKYNDELGFIPADKIGNSVSKALEYAYDDWCIAQMAKKMGKDQDHDKYMERSARYKKYYDESTGFMRGINEDGSWKKPFDPKFSDRHHGAYTEGNAYQWTWYIPHDVEGLKDLVGGAERMNERLDVLFEEPLVRDADKDMPAEVTGLIGQYAHGNEPSHHIIYLYNDAGQPWKAQFYADSVLNGLYTNEPAGISGNEDAGQMSAWYILSAMGFYQVCPGNPEYSIGRPLFDEVTVHLDNGKQFNIVARNNDENKPYIQSAELNGKPLNIPVVAHDDIIKGATLVFEMDEKPAKEWGLE